MKLYLFFAVLAVFNAAAEGTTFRLGQCVLMNVDGAITITGTEGQEEFSHVLDLTTATGFNITGNCTENATAVTMDVNFADSLTWSLLFTITAEDRAQMDQFLIFDPATLFDNTTLPTESQNLADVGNLQLSLTNESFICNAQQNIAYDTKTSGGFTFGASQVISNLQVQAFNLAGGAFSPAEECSQDETTTPQPLSTEPPVPPALFAVLDSQGQRCFLLQAGLQVVVEYNTTSDTMVLSNPIDIPGTSNVTGTCGADVATMIISNGDVFLEITETRNGEEASSEISLTVTLTATDFPNAAEPNTNVSFKMAGKSFEQRSVSTFYLCAEEQELQFEDTRTTLFANNVKLQAFNLDDGNFTGQGEQCNLNPTSSPAPATTTPLPPGENTYAVNNTEGNATCIVFKGDITFNNIVYTKEDNTTATVNAISIPTINETTQNVRTSGSCDLEGGNAQQLVIHFNTNWSISFTFARGTQQMLGATNENEYSVRDIVFVYFLTPEFFPNASDSGAQVIASEMNITSDLFKGAVRGGSFKCNSQLDQTLGNGVQLQTANMQLKAFNDNLDEGFNGNVDECSADEDSSNIVPIAVGAALGGLVLIVLIAYLIGRQRKNRKGYETV